MGKKQHSKDPLHITQTEWKYEHGGFKGISTKAYKKLPFYCCGLSFCPFDHPMCTEDGVVFDLENIVPFIKKFKSHPVTGKPLSAKDLIKLNFTKNAEGKFQCPVLFKTFTDNSHIVAIKTSGNIYSYEAISQLNFKTKNLTDLISGEPFTREDVIHIQNPNDNTKRELENFHHIREGLSAKVTDASKNIRVNSSIGRTLEEYKVKRKAKEEEEAEEARKKQATTSGMVRYKKHETTHHRSGGFTSTAMQPTTSASYAIMSEEELDKARYQAMRKKGEKAYAQLVTSHGNINLELHTDIVPMTCENFIKLLESGYYNGVKFHRLIKNFMVQGGDPEGTGDGGESIWKKPFKDEFSNKLSHSGAGILSMANSGPDSNGSQFFLTFKSCNHLDRKHSVFGRVVGGFDALKKMEKVPADEDDKPLEEVSITSGVVFVNPFETLEAFMDEEDAREEEEERKAKAMPTLADIDPQRGAWFSNPIKPEDMPEAHSSGVGKYMKPDAGKALTHTTSGAGAGAVVPKQSKPLKQASQMSDFSKW